MAKKKAWVDLKKCVACGTCINVCPVDAIKMIDGVYAKVDQDKCVGCSKCVKVCPASVIEIIEREMVV